MTPPGPPIFEGARAAVSRKAQVLDAYRREHATTMNVLRAYPPEHLDLRPHPAARSARELGWVFAVEGMLGTMVFRDEFADQAGGSAPPPPEEWDEILEAVEASHRDFLELIQSTDEEELSRPVRFFTGPRTLGQTSRIDWLWFLLHDSIHHRGQFSVYLRMAGGRVPSIYGPTSDESWS